MLIAQAILIALLADKPPVKVEAMDWDDPRIADTIKADFESIAGPGSVAVDRTDGKLFNIRIAVPSLSSDFCTPIYDHELKLFRLFPDLNFDFYLRLRDSN